MQEKLIKLSVKVLRKFGRSSILNKLNLFKKAQISTVEENKVVKKKKIKAKTGKKAKKMPSKAKRAPKRPKKIEFKFFAPLSKKVQLGGDFNKWKPAKARLRGSKAGIWSTSLNLKPGRYEYRFVIDGNWENDNQRQTELVTNSFGETNNVLVVE